MADSRNVKDGSDCGTKPTGVVFGHHFTSIARTGPIVGPASAVLWSWLPALLWVLPARTFGENGWLHSHDASKR